MPQWSELGVAGGQILSVGICDGAPSTARSSFICFDDYLRAIHCQINDMFREFCIPIKTIAATFKGIY